LFALEKVEMVTNPLESFHRFVRGVHCCLRLIGGLLCIVLLVTPLCASEEQIQVLVEGLSGKALENVKQALVLPPGIIDKGRVDELWLQRFEEQVPRNVREALEPFGYYQPEISVHREKTEGGIYRLRIEVKPGPPILVRSVHVRLEGAGAEESALKEQASTFPLAKGDILRHDLYEQAKQDLQNKAYDLGYLDAAYAIHTLRLILGELSADVDLVLQTGRRYAFGEVTFTGTPAFPDEFLRRYLAFKPGDVFSYKLIAKTQSNFLNTDRFREVLVNPRRDAVAEGRIPVDISLKPAPPKSVKTGIGYSTDTGPRASIHYKDLNVAGWGHEFQTELKVSPIVQGIASRYVLPSGVDIQRHTALTLSLQREDTDTYTTRLIKLETERAHGFGDGRSGSLFVQIQAENSEAGDQTTDSFLLMPGVRFTSIQYDNIIRPTRGFNYRIELRGTHEALGSDTGFIQGMSYGELLLPLPARLTLLVRAQAATTWQDDPARDLPVSVRFFAGGDRSVRGYTYQSLGPRDDSGKVVGGRSLLVGNVELERAIGQTWGVAAFYDAGNAFNSLSNIDAAQGAGIGVRYYSPFGPIRLDLARQIGVSEPNWHIHLTVGIGL
jgi:translocation and assembly module TamA